VRTRFDVAPGDEAFSTVVESADLAAFRIGSRGGRGVEGAAGAPGLSGRPVGECADGQAGTRGLGGGSGGPGGAGGSVDADVVCNGVSDCVTWPHGSPGMPGHDGAAGNMQVRYSGRPAR
jgi:hypothetical protein